MDKIPQPHDKFFKETFSQPKIARDVIQHYLPPEIVDTLDLNSLELQKDSYVEKMQEYLSDMLYRIQMKDGNSAFVYFLFEHKSFLDKWVTLQLLRYMVGIWEQMRVEAKSDEGGKRPFTLAPILPIVIAHGEKKWNIGQKFDDLFDMPTEMEMYFPNFSYKLIDLSEASDEAIVGLAETRFVLEIMRYIRTKELFGEIVRVSRLIQMGKDDELVSYLIPIGFYYMMQYRNDLTVDDLRQATTLANLPQGDDVMATLADRLRNEGFQLGVEQGVQQGVQQGRQQGVQEIILKLLQSRFQTVPKNIAAKLRTIHDFDVLTQLATTTGTVASLDDFTDQMQQYAY